MLLVETTRRIDEIVERTQATSRVPALVAGVVRDGVVAHRSAAGEPPPEPDTQFRIGSITKTMTSALVLMLRDEGRLSLDDLLYRHLPGTPVGGVSLRHLLGHVSGLQREPEGDWWERSAGQDLDALLAGLTAEKLAYPPYRSFHYSNLGFALLGAVLTRLTGLSWLDLMTDRILAPLGMRRTTYQATEPFARGYVVHPWYDTLREEPREDSVAMAPAGQLWSTVDDLLRWAAFVAAPDPSLLAPTTMGEMCAPVVIRDADAWTSGHGLGVELWRRGERVYTGHTGSMPGYLAVLAVHRSTRTGVVAFANAYGMTGTSIAEVGHELLAAVLDREPARTEIWRPGAGAPPPYVAELCGVWWWMGGAFAVGWDPRTRELVVTPQGRAGVPPWRFVEDSPDRWRGRSGMNDGEILRVRRDADGTANALDIATFVFTRVP